MFGIRINFVDGPIALVITGIPDAEKARAIAFNANKARDVAKCDILSADMLPTTSSPTVTVRDHETGAII